jgi:hypothetical protein
MPSSGSAICPKCNRPMTSALPPSGKGPRVLRCLECDGIDPMQSPDILGWVESLRPPAKP